MDAYWVPTCECGHKVGEHRSGGTRWPHPPSFGVCLSRECDCREFVEATPATVSSEKEA